jgi:hypothetical protein
MFLGGSYHDRDNPHNDKTNRVKPPSDRTSSSASGMQLPGEVSDSSSSNSSKFRQAMRMRMRMMMKVFYRGISTKCTEHQNSNPKQEHGRRDDEGHGRDLPRPGRMEDDEDDGTPMLSATGTLDRKTGQATPMRQSAIGTLDRKTDQATPTTCFHNHDDLTKQRNQSKDTTTKNRNQRNLPTYTKNKPTDQLTDDEGPTSESRLRHEDTTRTKTTMKATMMRTQPMAATNGSNRWKQPMEALDGTTLTDYITADGKWNGGQMPIEWIDVCEALYCKALKAATTARREGFQR